ncbi:MAG: M12 family metallopeptidase [Gemmatimonadetes bacterium]|nr:M12 family metallopeptidase [Gemmatimonadota bacterium]
MSTSEDDLLQDRGDWLRAGDETRTAPVAINHVTRKELQYSPLDGMAVFEGDIVLGTEEQMQAAREGGTLVPMGVGITGEQFRWPRGIIPYQIHPALPNAERVTQAIAHWEARTRIRFVQRTGQNAHQYPDYVSFEARSGCWSQLGRRGGKQVISLGSGCGLGQAIHEIGHTVGLWHEQSREDRDQHVEIRWQNISQQARHNFEQHVLDGDDLGAYDFGSIMHYPALAFSSNGQPTIVPKKPVQIGQRTALSDGDVAAVQALYPELYV